MSITNVALVMFALSLLGVASLSRANEVGEPTDSSGGFVNSLGMKMILVKGKAFDAWTPSINRHITMKRAGGQPDAAMALNRPRVPIRVELNALSRDDLVRILTEPEASLIKQWLAGTHQGAVSHEHLGYYLDEYTFRFNRRKSKSRGLLFYRLIGQAIDLGPVLETDLKAATGNQKKAK